MANMKLADFRQLGEIFSSSASYAVGDYCYYQGIMYECTTAHTGAWNASHFRATNIADEFTAVASDTAGLAGNVTTLQGNVSTLQGDVSTLQGDVSTLQSDVADLQDDSSDLKEAISALPEDGIVANALQLDSNVYTEDHAPYLFRKSVGGSRKYMELVGASFPVNQLSEQASNVEKTFSEDSSSYFGTFGLFRNTTNYTTILNHKYYIKIDCERSISTNNQCAIGFVAPATGLNVIYDNGEPNGVKETISNCSSVQTSRAFSYNNYSGKRGFSAGDTITIKHSNLVDITQMFGTTIADYAYSLEQANVGSGVAWLKAHGFFTKDYYPYNAGTMQSVLTSGHETVGFNLFDKSTATEHAYLNASGEIVTNSSDPRAVSDYIKIIPNTQYYFKNVLSQYQGRATAFYDAGKSFISIGVIADTTATEGIIVTPNNAMYMRISAYGTGIDSVCANISDPTKNGTYEPYEKHEYPLEAVELKGYPYLDSNNELRYFGDTYRSDGLHTSKFAMVDLGTLDWSYNSTYSTFISITNTPMAKAPCVCTAYSYNDLSVGSSRPDKTINVGVDYFDTAHRAVSVKDTGYTDVATFKTAMSGQYLVFEKATYATEQLTPFQSPMICDENGTEEFIDERTVPIPVGTNTEYPTNQVKKLDGLPSDFSTLIAPTEKTTTASRNYAVGNYLIYKNVLYKVTSPIASGGTITIGTNVTATTIMAELLALA